MALALVSGGTWHRAGGRGESYRMEPGPQHKRRPRSRSWPLLWQRSSCGKHPGPAGAPTLGILFSHGWGVVLIPVHRVLIRQHNDVALSLPFLGTAHHDGQDELFEVVIKLLVSSIVGQFVQQSTWGEREQLGTLPWKRARDGAEV